MFVFVIPSFLFLPNHYVANYILVCSNTNNNGDICMLVSSTLNHYVAIYILKGILNQISMYLF